MDNKLNPVESLGLSTRSSNSLRRAGIHTVGDLLELTSEDILKIKNLGIKSKDEIEAKIIELKSSDFSFESESHNKVEEDFDSWCQDTNNRNAVNDFLKSKNTKLEVLPLLSPKAYNILKISGYDYLWQFNFWNVSVLMNIPKMENYFADEIHRHCLYYVKENIWKTLTAATTSKEPVFDSTSNSIYDLIKNPEYHQRILEFTKRNNIKISDSTLSNRAKNQLTNNGFTYLSDIVFLTKEDISKLKGIGSLTIDDTYNWILSYLSENEQRIVAYAKGDDSVLIDDESVYNMILSIYNTIGFKGLSFNEIKEKLNIPKSISDQRIKSIIGKLLSEEKLIYVDFRCHRVFESFKEYVDLCPTIDKRSKEVIFRRLNGETLTSIAETMSLSKERVRQVQSKDTKKVRAYYTSQTGLELFDEDYYRYFFETYAFDKKDIKPWLGIPDYLWNYFEVLSIKQGNQDLNLALEDTENLDTGLRLKVKTYLNRNNLFIDGVWVPKVRADIEIIVAKKFCSESKSFTEFTSYYNDFLREMEVDANDEIYYSADIARTRKNRLAESRFILWTQNETIRYYEIDSRDYTELLDALNLEAYKNIEISTLKLYRMYPDVMSKYDIRNHYELHNLLRKIVPDGSYNDFHLSRTPDIRFGTFDRDKALYEIMVANAPISTQDLADLINEEYGYDHGIVLSTYIQCLNKYYHQGIYSLDHKKMSAENQSLLSEALTEDFYYLDEITEKYLSIVADANIEEINPYTLKSIGFLVFSKYALRNHSSLEAYFEYLLTKEDITELTKIKSRYAYIQSFYAKYASLKRNLDIIEISPKETINIRKLEDFGITKDMLYDFCDDVYDFVDSENYFSIQSIISKGFVHELFDLGFDNWFYANILISDNRLSFATMYNNIIFFKGKKDITVKSFSCELIEQYESVDAYDLLNKMAETYGCTIDEKADMIYKAVTGTSIYYDKILDRLYVNYDAYYRELEEKGGM